MHRDWEFQKRKIFDELGQHQPGTSQMDWSGGNVSMHDGSRGFNPSTAAVSRSRREGREVKLMSIERTQEGRVREYRVSFALPKLLGAILCFRDTHILYGNPHCETEVDHRF